MLVNKVNDKIEIHQAKYDKFAVIINGIIVRQSQDLEAIECPSNDEIKQYMKTYRQLKKHQNINKKHQERIDKAQNSTRIDFIINEVKIKTRRSKEYKIKSRRNGNFDITFMSQPVWTNIEKENMENWLERTGMRDFSQDASKFWTENN